MLAHAANTQRHIEGRLVSIITPFFNAEPFLAEAIDSVLAQTLDNWELLLIDDGSRDGSARIAQEYAASDPARIRYLAHAGHQNLGQGASRNLGLAQASGRYVTFLDADDVFLPSKLEIQAGILARNPDVDLVFGNTLYWYSWNKTAQPQATDWLPTFRFPLDTVFQPPELLPLVLGTGGAAPCVCSFMAKRSVIDVRGRFDTRINRLYEDQALLAKLFLQHVALLHDGHLEKYRQRTDSTWQTSFNNGTDKAARRDYLQWLLTYAKRSGAIDSTHEHAIRSQLRRAGGPKPGTLLNALMRVTRSLKHAAHLGTGQPKIRR